MKSQKQAVVDVVNAVFEDAGIEFTNNQEQPANELLTEATKASVRAILFEGFRNLEITLNDKTGKFQEDSELKKYVSGLVNNHLRKAKELNGNTTYKAKNPGSRAGSGDSSIKAMRALLRSLPEGSADVESVKQAIQARVAEIKPASVTTIDVDALPENLRHLV